MKKIPCSKCGNLFEPTSKYDKICSDCRYYTCEICGKKYIPNNIEQRTCSRACSVILRKQNGGFARATSAKPSSTKICPLCGKEFLPDTFRQRYCKGPHYKPCPVCGKPVECLPYEVDKTCSPECRTAKIQQTCLEKYGHVNVLNSEHGKMLSKQTCLERYGVDCPQKSERFRSARDATMIARYGVVNPMQNPEIAEKTKATNQERYGGNSPMCSPEVKSKALASATAHYGGFGYSSPILLERIKQTNIERYGSPFTFSSEVIKDKIRQTFIEKYGTSNIASVPSVVAKRQATSLARYGTKFPSQSEVIKKKAKQTMLEKYGVSNIMELQEYVDLARKNAYDSMIEKYGKPYSVWIPEIKEKISRSMQAKYGVPWFMFSEKFRNSGGAVISATNLRFKKLLDRNGLKSTQEFPLSYTVDSKFHRFWYDFKLDDSLTLIEINPTYTHNSYKNHWDAELPANYHLNKLQVAMENGYRCVHIFDWDPWEKIVSTMLVSSSRIFARKCKLVKVSQSDANAFTETNHVQGKCNGQVINYGLEFEGELVELMTFGTPRYTKKYDFELLRLCSKIGYVVVGGASKLFSTFVKDHATANVISYCNLSKFSGAVYEKIGMKLDHISPPAKIWSRNREYVTDNLLRQRGFDQLFGTSYGKGTSNEELMISDGWLPVYDCGQAVYVYGSTDS